MELGTTSDIYSAWPASSEAAANGHRAGQCRVATLNHVSDFEIAGKSSLRL
jgi:hypothetical protein